MQQEELKWGEPHRTARDLGDLRGEVVFASAEEQAQRSTELLGAGALVVTLPPPSVESRGHLGDLLEELVERELARMGAPSPYLAAWAAMPEDAQARLADQLFRTRTVGATGLAIAMGSLAAIATPVLTPDDSATLRWLAGVTGESPLVLMIDDGDVGLSAYAEPVSLSSIIARTTPAPWTIEAAPSSCIDIEVELEAEEAAAEPLPALEIEMELDIVVDEATTNETRVASIDVAEAILQAPESECMAETSLASGAALEQETARETLPEATEPEPMAAAAEPEAAEAAVVAEPATVVVAPPVPEPSPAPPAAVAREEDATLRIARTEWRTWTSALMSARGAQPLAAFERLFAESYVPLSNAIAAGLDETRALRAYEEFRRSFERSYTDAFATFGATNRRPRLVMDAYDLASKQARLSNARSSHVLIVDSMRFDLGLLVRDALRREAAGVATLTSETLLWSALPTTTIRQLETFARGLDALRAPAEPSQEEPSESLRGRAAEVVRRLRVGSRELYKLDLVPSLLDGFDPEANLTASLRTIAEAVAEAIARHISTLPARTLLYIVGDHGFGIDRRGEIQVGGASPEEVLVPAFGWLIGDLH